MAITLLALSPTVLPHGTTSLVPVPGPIAGAVQVGRVVASSLGAPDKERAQAADAGSRVSQPAADESSSAQSGPSDGSGVLTAVAGGTLAGDDKAAPPTKNKKPKPAPSFSGPKGGGGAVSAPPAKDDDDEDEDEDDHEPSAPKKAENEAKKAEKKAQKAAEKAEKKAEKEKKKAGKKAKTHGEHGDDEDEDDD